MSSSESIVNVHTAMYYMHILPFSIPFEPTFPSLCMTQACLKSSTDDPILLPTASELLIPCQDHPGLYTIHLHDLKVTDIGVLLSIYESRKKVNVKGKVELDNLMMTRIHSDDPYQMYNVHIVCMTTDF